MSQAARTSTSVGLHNSTSLTIPLATSTHTTLHRVKSFSRINHSDFPNERPSKRQKLEIRGPKQQTLDTFFSPTTISTAPVKIAQQQPNGPLVETINGVRSELAVTTNGASIAVEGDQPRASKKLKPASAQKQEEKRTLRSQDDGPRLKSELATYFGNYEDIMFDAPREVEFVNADSSLYIVDDTNKAITPSPSKSMKSSKGTPGHERMLLSPSAFPLKPTVIDFSSIMKSVGDGVEDPLTDAAFMVSHRRAERKEKQMRNIEREHAMHEKVQLDRLLEGLRGHDWLKVLGVTGVTDGEAKKFEAKRDYFIEEVQTLVDKFNEWKDEEKRQRLEREAILAAERELEEAEDDEASSTANSEPASSDLNRSASRQLQQEAEMALSKAKKKEKAPAIPPVPYRPPSPITSFYSSRHMRESALKKTRNSRNALAFGLPMPEIEEHDFILPPEYLTQDILNASARERRRRQRESTSNVTAGASRDRPP